MPAMVFATAGTFHVHSAIVTVAPVARLVELHMKPLHRLLETVGVEDPMALSLS